MKTVLFISRPGMLPAFHSGFADCEETRLTSRQLALEVMAEWAGYYADKGYTIEWLSSNTKVRATKFIGADDPTPEDVVELFIS